MNLLIIGRPIRTRRLARRRPLIGTSPRPELLEGRALLATVTVQVVDFTFTPNSVTIHPGDTVHWVWGNDMHSTTSVAGRAESWDSGVHDTGFTFDHTFTHTGTFAYFCLIHGHDNGNGTAGGMSGTITVVAAATLRSIAVTPANPSILAGGTEPFLATGTFSDASTQNLTGQVVWASMTPSVATVNAAGLATGLTMGTSRITASLGGISGFTTLTVNASPTTRMPSIGYVIGGDDQVYSRAVDSAGNPTGGYQLTASGPVKDVEATRFGGGTRVEAFVIGTDNQAYAETFDAANHSSGYFQAAFGSVSSLSAGTDASGRPLLFAVGTDDQLYEKKFDANGHPTSGGYTKAAFGDFRSTVLTHSASGNPLLYAVGQDGQVYGLKLDGAGTPAGGLFKVDSGPVKQLAVGADAGQTPELFVIGTDDGVYGHKLDATGGPVGRYFGLGGPVRSISVGSDAANRPLVFAIGTDNQAYGHRFDAAGTPTGNFYATAAVSASAITAGIAPGGNPELFAIRSADSQVDLGPLDPTGSSTGPFVLTSSLRVKKVVAV